MLSKNELASYFDHTYLKQTMTQDNLLQLKDETLTHNFFSMCIPPLYVKEGALMLKDSPSKLTTVIGFPLGYTTLKTKEEETYHCLALGADEIDMVASVPYLKNKDFALYGKEIESLKKICNQHILKVIIETSLLTSEEITLASKICYESGADFVKTSTGFGRRGASLEDIHLIKLGAPKTQIKASGGIRTLDDALFFIEAGVTRIGSSNSVEIIESLSTL